MDISHEAVVAFSKSYGLFYLIFLSIGVLLYACWPSNRKRFEEAANGILDDEDKPCR